MGATIVFSPAVLDFGVTERGSKLTQTASSAILSAPANVTATITGEKSGGPYKVTAIRSFIEKEEVDLPQPGELPPGSGGKPVKGVRTLVPQQVAKSDDGMTPLAVESGQCVEVDVEFFPTGTTPDETEATLVIQADTWNPVSIPMKATVAKLAAVVPAITVTQNSSTTVEITVTDAGPATTARLIVDADGSAELPNVTPSLDPKSVMVSEAKPGKSKLTVTADASLATGPYSWNLAVWAFDNAYSFSVPFIVMVKAPKVLGKLNLSHSPSELVRGQPADILITATDQATGKAVPGLKVTASSGFHGFDPIGPNVSNGVTGTAFSYTPNVYDNSAAVLVIGSPNYEDYAMGLPLVDPTEKVWCNNRDPSRFIVYGSGFLSDICEVTVDGEGTPNTTRYTGNIKTGIPVKVLCDNPLGGQYWTIHVQSLGGGIPITKKVPCPSSG